MSYRVKAKLYFKKFSPFHELTEREKIALDFHPKYVSTVTHGDDETSVVIETEQVLKDLNNYVTADTLTGQIIDFSEEGGIFFFSDPDNNSLQNHNIDFVRAFLSTSRQLMVDEDTAEERIMENSGEITPESIRGFFEEEINFFFGRGLKQSFLDNYQQILEDRELKSEFKNAKPGYKKQPESQQTL